MRRLESSAGGKMKHILICLLVLTAAACASVPKQTPTGWPERLAWGNSAWDRALYEAIEEHQLTSVQVADADDFSLDHRDSNAWAKIFVQMAKFESNWNPRTEFFECKNGSNPYGSNAFFDAKRGWCMFGQKHITDGFIVSSGLFQISFASANARGCNFQTQSELLDGEANIKCAVRIFAYWVKRDGRIAGIGPGRWRGGARYWAVLRGTTDHTQKALAAIKRANE